MGNLVVINFVDNPNIELREGKFGKGLVTTAPIKKGEVIAEFDGPFYDAPKATDLPPHTINHAIQVGPHQWRDSNGLARYINHSCEPNVGMKGLFMLVAMRDIEPGEELLWDYDMSENSDWRMECGCGTPSCRHTIGSFDALSTDVKAKYNGYISAWLQ